MTDDQRWDNLGCYGRPEFKTEHIDRLAAEGLLLQNAYYAVSICMPSRATAMTGRHLSSHHCGFSYPYNTTIPKREMLDSYPYLLKQAGYRTGFVGKFGFGVTDERQRPSMFGDYDAEKYYSLLFDFYAIRGAQVGRGQMNWPRDDQKLAEIFSRRRPANERTLKTGDAMLHFIDTQPDDQPFCLSVSFFAVKHDRDETDVYPPHAELFAGKEMPYPDNWVEGPNEKLPKVVKDNWRGHRLHVERTGIKEKYQDEVQDFAVQAYSVDQQVGRLVEKLKERGLLDNTVIIFTSDNGRFQGSHGLYDKALLYQESVKAPMIVFDARSPENQRGRRLQAMYSSVDHASTILGYAGIEAPESMEGYDFSPLFMGASELEPRDTVLMESLFIDTQYGRPNNKGPVAEAHNQATIDNNDSYRCRGVVTKRWKYFVYYEHKPVIEELYDLKADPLEQVNLVHEAEHAQTLQELRTKCEQMYQRIAKPLGNVDD